MNTGSCRIIGGKWRGRKVVFDDAAGLRPTTDRIRETLFNWLQPCLFHSHCLDLFAGSGALGLEALSRGAKQVVFIEKNRKTAANISKMLQLFSADGGQVFNQDALLWLQACASQASAKQYEVVFLDPPFASGLLEKAALLLDQAGCLADDAVIYVEHASNDEFTAPAGWQCMKDKRAGQVNYRLFSLS